MTDFTTGVAGLFTSGILGAVLGLAFGVLFEDYLKRRWIRSLRAVRIGWRRITRRRPGTITVDTLQPFKMGKLKTSLIIFEGDGEIAIPESDVRLIIKPDRVVLPEEVARWKEEIAQEQEDRHAVGKSFRWNGNNYALESIGISRDPVSETSSISLVFQSADYFTFLATQQLDREMSDGTTLRSKYLDGRSPLEVPTFMSCSFGINIAVTTSDDYLMFSRRSNRVFSNAGMWNSSANEALSRGLDSRGAHPPNLYDVARRGLEEELGLDKSECDLQLLGITLDANLHQWGCLFWAQCRTVTADRWSIERTANTQDGWEHDLHTFVPFTPKAALRFIAKVAEEDGGWPPAPPALYYLTLVRRYGKKEVNNQVQKIFN